MSRFVGALCWAPIISSLVQYIQHQPNNYEYDLATILLINYECDFVTILTASRINTASAQDSSSVHTTNLQHGYPTPSDVAKQRH